MSYLVRNAIRELFNSRFAAILQNGLPNEEPPIAPIVFRKRGSGVTQGATYTPEIRWQNIEKIESADNGKHWLHFQVIDITNQQKSLTGGRNEGIGTHYQARGLVRVDLYFSKSAYLLNEAEILSLFVQRCFMQQSTVCGLWFKNTVINDLPPGENHFRSVVLSDYSYETVIK